MPRVPDQFGLGVGLNPTPQTTFAAPTVTPVRDVSGQQQAQFGQALIGLGTAHQNIAFYLQGEVNTAQVKKADGLAADTIRKAMFAPEKGYTNLRGQTALDAREGVIKAVEADLNDIAGMLDNPAQQQMFAERVEQRRQTFLRQVDGHYSKAQLTFAVGQSEARMTTLMRDAHDAVFGPETIPEPQVPGAERGLGSRPGDPVQPLEFEDYVTALRGEAQTITELMGLPSESAQVLADSKVSELHESIITEWIDNNRSGEAQAHLDVFGDDLLPQVESELRGRTRRARYAEQGYFAANRAEAGEDSPLEQIEWLRTEFEGGRLPFPAMTAGLQEVIRRDEQRRTLTAARGIAALDEMQTWAQAPANRGKDLSESQWEKLRDAGVEVDMQLWLEQGKQFLPTMAGYNVLNTITEGELLEHHSFDTLQDEHQLKMSVGMMKELRTKWERAWGAATKAGQGSGAGHNIGLNASVIDLLRQRSSLFTTGRADERETWRVTAFTNAVNREFAALDKGVGIDPGKVTQSELDAVITEVWNRGAVVGGVWMPVVMMTAAEKKEMVHYFRSEDQKNVSAVLPEDFDVGQPFAKFRDKNTGLPDFDALAATDTDPNSLADGLAVIEGLPKGESTVTHQDPATGEVLQKVESAVPQYETARDALRRANSDSSHPEVMRVLATAIAEHGLSLKSAQEAYEAHIELRKAKLLQKASEEYQRLVAKGIAGYHSTRAWHEERVAQLKAKVDAKHPKASWQKEADHLVVRKENGDLLKLLPIPHAVLFPMDDKELKRDAEDAAWDRINKKYADEIEAFGLIDLRGRAKQAVKEFDSGLYGPGTRWVGGLFEGAK